MGLFGNKKQSKELPVIKGSDIMSSELAEKIISVAGHKDYGIQAAPYVSSIVDFAKSPDKEYTKKDKDLTAAIMGAGMLTKLEPDLAPLLNDAIAKYKEFKKR
ncbi:MAG: hypothetical protein II718_09235 [Clostridiales bacterium]|nr:hypothetical protein [Clostridiales bacterium]